MRDLSDNSNLPRILATNKDVIYKRDESPIRKVMPGKKRLAVRSWVRIPVLAKKILKKSPLKCICGISTGNIYESCIMYLYSRVHTLQLNPKF